MTRLEKAVRAFTVLLFAFLGLVLLPGCPGVDPTTAVSTGQARRACENWLSPSAIDAQLENIRVARSEGTHEIVVLGEISNDCPLRCEEITGDPNDDLCNSTCAQCLLGLTLSVYNNPLP